MKIGYARVSKGDKQNNALQIAALKRAGCRKILTDEMSGDRMDRPGMVDAIGALKKGDVLVVWKLDRFSRSLFNLLSMLRTIDERGAGFKSLTEPIDTTTPAGRMMLAMIGAMAEFELRMIRERTRAGLRTAAAAGRIGGRPRKLNGSQERAAIDMVENEDPALKKSIPHVAYVMGVAPITIKRVLKRIRDKRIAELTKGKTDGTAKKTDNRRTNHRTRTRRQNSVGR